jgi:hypothetical protein
MELPAEKLDDINQTLKRMLGVMDKPDYRQVGGKKWFYNLLYP